MRTDFEVVPLENRHVPAYRRMLDSWPALPIQAGLEHREFLRRILPQAEDRYLLAVTPQGAVLGALPTFLARPPGHPGILNALPFFGGHGGPYTAKEAPDPHHVQTALLKAFVELAATQKVAAATLVSSPMDTDVAWFSQVLGSPSQDWRMGQISTLPQCSGEPETADELLMAGFHQKTRNAVRKGLKGGYRLRLGGSDCDFEALRILHAANM
ncbi:MAG TPA: hypothetical protein VGR45_18225, partial [Stellaceae bacterium]|nr:hypothetical protein [Stellaceae bacterium]